MNKPIDITHERVNSTLQDHYESIGYNIDFDSLISENVDETQIISMLKGFGIRYIKRVEDYEAYALHSVNTTVDTIVAWKFIDDPKEHRFVFFNFPPTYVHYSRKWKFLDKLFGKKSEIKFDNNNYNLPLLVMLIIWKRQGISNEKLELRAKRYYDYVRQQLLSDSTIFLDMFFYIITETYKH